MTEAAVLFVCAFIMAGVYMKTSRPKLYAFFNTAAGCVSLAAAELLMNGSIEGISIYKAAMSVILGLPGTLLQILLKMM